MRVLFNEAVKLILDLRDMRRSKKEKKNGKTRHDQCFLIRTVPGSTKCTTMVFRLVVRIETTSRLVPVQVALTTAGMIAA